MFPQSVPNSTFLFLYASPQTIIYCHWHNVACLKPTARLSASAEPIISYTMSCLHLRFKKAAGSSQCLSSENALLQTLSVATNTSPVSPRKLLTHRRHNRWKWSGVGAPASHFAAKHRSDEQLCSRPSEGCSVPSAARAIKQQTGCRENITQHKKTARLYSTAAVTVIWAERTIKRSLKVQCR